MEKYEISSATCFYRRCHPETCCCGDDELLVIENVKDEHGAFQYSRILESVYSEKKGDEIISLLKEKDQLEEKVARLEWEANLKECSGESNKKGGEIK